MRAIHLNSYGGPEVLVLGEVDDPPLAPDGVLVDVRAAGVNPVDTKIRGGYLDGAFATTFPLVPGWDVSGVVAAVGPAVTTYAPGDDVVGYVRKDVIGGGTYADQVVAWERHLAPKPSSVDHLTAAGLPLAGLTAMQSLDVAGVGSGDTVLVHAGAGGVGSLACQLAVSRGARVLATASPGNHEYLRELGAEPLPYGDDLLDRLATAAPDGVDAAVDYVGGESVAVSERVLHDRSRGVSVIDPADVAEHGGRYVFVRPDPAGLAELAAMVDGGSLTVRIAEIFPLADAAAAHQLLEQGHVRGKIVLDVAGGR